MKSIAVTSVCIATALLWSAGCASVEDPTRPPRHKTVECDSISALDYIELVYKPVNDNPAIPHVVRLSISGSGYVVLKTGPSPQVTDDFATDSAAPNWNDFVEGRRAYEKAEIQELFETLVDGGIIPARRLIAREQLTMPMVNYIGKIGFEKFSNTTSNTYICDLIADFIETNFKEELRRSATFKRVPPVLVEE